MGKKKKLKKKLQAEIVEIPGIDLKNGDLAEFFTRNTTKSGKFIGSKKKKKVMRDTCIHNTYRDRKHMKHLTPHIRRGSKKGYCNCEMCKNDIRVQPYTKQEVKDIVNAHKGLLSHMQLGNQAIGGGKNATNFIASMQLADSKVPKLYENINGALMRRDKVKKDKKKKHRDSKDIYGTWDVR